jgi:hypothetical protein
VAADSSRSAAGSAGSAIGAAGATGAIGAAAAVFCAFGVRRLVERQVALGQDRDAAPTGREQQLLALDLDLLSVDLDLGARGDQGQQHAAVLRPQPLDLAARGADGLGVALWVGMLNISGEGIDRGLGLPEVRVGDPEVQLGGRVRVQLIRLLKGLDRFALLVGLKGLQTAPERFLSRGLDEGRDGQWSACGGRFLGSHSLSAREQLRDKARDG